MKLIRGKLIAGKILKKLKKDITAKKLKPLLAVVLIGENKASKLYIKLKARAAKKVGIKLILYKFKSGAKERDITKLIKSLNKNKKINGIIVQLPLPKKYSARKIISAVSPQKDADGFSAKGGSAFGGHPSKNFIKPLPVFPTAIMKLLESAKINLKNKKAAIIANSEIFGKIMKSILIKKKAEVRIISRLNIDRKLKNADVIITAVGRPKSIKGQMIKKGAVIIDGGITKKGRKALGDVDCNSIAKYAGYLSPVPGGVGPVTVACLLENVYQLSLAQGRKK